MMRPKLHKTHELPTGGIVSTMREEEWNFSLQNIYDNGGTLLEVTPNGDLLRIYRKAAS